MDAVVRDVLPIALAVAIAPPSIIALVLLLLSPRARANGIAFTTGRILGLAVVVGIVLAVAPDDATGTEKRSPAAASIVKLLAGILLVIVGVWRWRRHRRATGDPELPGWMQRLHQAEPRHSLPAGFLLSAVEPLTLALAVDAGLTIARAGLPVASSLAALALFVAVATVTNTVPVAIYLAGATTADQKLDAVHRWVTSNHEPVIMVLLFVFGVILIGRGVTGT